MAQYQPNRASEVKVMYQPSKKVEQLNPRGNWQAYHMVPTPGAHAFKNDATAWVCNRVNVSDEAVAEAAEEKAYCVALLSSATGSNSCGSRCSSRS